MMMDNFINKSYNISILRSLNSFVQFFQLSDRTHHTTHPLHFATYLPFHDRNHTHVYTDNRKNDGRERGNETDCGYQ